jgi:hypothetical protein
MMVSCARLLLVEGDGGLVLGGAGRRRLIFRRLRMGRQRTPLRMGLGANLSGLHRWRRGVVFADYDLPGLKTVEHVCVLGSEKAAWFSDSEGSILCLHEDLP